MTARRRRDARCGCARSVHRALRRGQGEPHQPRHPTEGIYARAKPVSRTVRLSLPLGSPSSRGPVLSKTFGTPWYTRRLGPPNTRRSPERSGMSRNGAVRRSTPAIRNRHVSPRLMVTTGSVRWLLGVLMEARAARPARTGSRSRRPARSARRSTRRTCRPRPVGQVERCRKATASLPPRRCRPRCGCMRTAASASRGTRTARSSGDRSARVGDGGLREEAPRLGTG